MSKFLSCTILFVLIFSLQVSAEKIHIKKTFFGGWKYSTDSIEYKGVGNSGTGLYNLMEGNADAQDQMLRYKKNKTWAAVTGIPGGFLVGWPLGGYAGSSEWKDGYTTMLIVGIPLSIVSLITEASATKNLKNAVKIFNGEESSLSMSLNYIPRLNSNNNDLLVTLNLSF